MSQSERPRVLVVDDEPGFAASLADILAGRGYECLTTGTVREAAEMAGRLQPDICLVDLNLPDGTGLDLIRRMRSVSPETESVIITGAAAAGATEESASLGVAGYIQKPLDMDRLFKTLQKTLEHQHLVRVAQRSRTAYTELMHAAGAAIFTVAAAGGRVSDVNPAFTRLLGYSPEEADRLTIDQLLPDSERPAVTRMLTELSTARPDQAQNLTLEAPLRRKDGVASWFAITAARLARGNGTPAADRVAGIADLDHAPEPAPAAFDLLLFCNDTSASRKSLAELEQTRGRIEGVLASLGCGVAIVNSDYQVIDANAAWFKPLGLDRSKARTRHCHEAFSDYKTPCSMFGEQCPIAAARAAGASGRVFREHRLPDGSLRYLEYTATPLLDETGGMSAFVLVVNDLTNLHETEARLEHAKDAMDDLNNALTRHHEELEDKNARLELAGVELARLSGAKSQFVDAISQELRTPLAAISDGVGLVEDGSVGALNTEQQTFLRLAVKNTKRLADLLNDLLDLSKLEAGRMEVHPHRLDLREVAREVAITFDGIARDNRQTLKVDLAKDLEPVLADEQSVMRILTNIVGNALKFTPSGGSVTIAADRLAPGAEPKSESAPPASSGARMVLSVSDTGIGIGGDQQPRGKGLGLVLSRRLTEMNGGQIWSQSEEGKGSTFSFTLPVYTEFAGLAADLRYFASTVADSRGGPPAVYCFRVQPRKEGAGALPRLEELLDALFPKPVILSPADTGCGVLVFSPRKVAERELLAIVESLRGASLVEGRKKADVHLYFGALDYEQLRTKLGALPAGVEPEPDVAIQWWDTLFGELRPGLTEIL